jgi:hypothetical protein
MAGVMNQAMNRVCDSDVFEKMSGVFQRRCFEVYEHCISLLTYIISE